MNLCEGGAVYTEPTEAPVQLRPWLDLACVIERNFPSIIPASSAYAQPVLCHMSPPEGPQAQLIE